jgi:diguanylate cyclase (GGDEF)-like protein
MRFAQDQRLRGTDTTDVIASTQRGTTIEAAPRASPPTRAMSALFLTFDVRTLLTVTFTSSVLMAAVLWFVFAGRFRDGLASWTQSLWVQALAWLLIALRGTLHDLISVAAANGLLALGWSLQLAAVLEFQRRHVPAILAWGPPVLVFTLFHPIIDDARLQLIVGGWVYGAFCVAIAAAALTQRPASGFRAYALFAGAYLLAAAAIIVHCMGAWLGHGHFETSAAAGAYRNLQYLIANALVVASSLAYLLMHRERADEETRRLAITDPLTGVFNRRTFIELAERELARSRREASALSLMILDLDHFKQVNDTFGHLAGDDVLVAFTALVRDRVRRGDLVVRYGGEEFCVLLPATSLPAAVALAERIRAATAASVLTPRPVRITVSIGVTAYTGGREVTLEALLGRADEALYRAKDEGRNRVVALPLADEELAGQRPLPLEGDRQASATEVPPRWVSRS